MEQMEFHQHSHLSPADGPKDQFAEIYNQASFFFTLTPRRLQLWELRLKRGGTALKNRAISQSIHQLIKAAEVRLTGDCSLANIMCAQAQQHVLKRRGTTLAVVRAGERLFGLQLLSASLP